MRLDPESLQIQSFTTAGTVDTETDTTTSDTGPGGPYSYCYLCRPSDPGAPSCDYGCEG